MTETWSEAELDAADSRLVGLLTYVLRYDDLRAGDAFTLPPLGDRGPMIEIGRAAIPSCPRFEDGCLLLPDRFVSSRHARIQRIGLADYVRDLGSKHHSFVNGDEVEERALKDGDLIEVGHSLLCYRRVPSGIVESMSGKPYGIGPTKSLSLKVGKVLEELQRLALTDTSILLLGERGAGKELVAEHIHARSQRGPFLAVDCGAVTETLFESEFFGHERAAFPEARKRLGYIRSVDGGTLFLDEVANLTPRSQEKLLRVIETGKVIPVGADKASSFNVRWISATNADIFNEAKFRPDLRDRLAQYVAHLPPLRERREDLGVLAAHFLADLDVSPVAITKAAARHLFGGPLPGNIRQLRVVLRTAAVLAQGSPIDLHHLTATGIVDLQDSNTPPTTGSDPSIDAMQSRAHPSANQIRTALTRTRGNQTRAAAMLKINPRQLYRRLRELGISIDEFKR